MFATLAMGGSDTSHKNVDASRSKILNLYYTNRVSYPPSGSDKVGLLTTASDRTIRLLRAERSLLHCSVSPELLIAHIESELVEGCPAARCRSYPQGRGGQLFTPQPPLHQSVQCRRSRACTGQQDGQLLALGDCRLQLPRHGPEADH